MKDMNILVIEDDKTLRFVVDLQLRQLGYKADFAENGKIGVEKFEHQPYDLIFMDIMMPEMDGIEATHCIRDLERAREKRTSIVAMTAFQEKQRCLEAGMDDFIFKPVLIDRLKQAILQWGKEPITTSSEKPVNIYPPVSPGEEAQPEALQNKLEKLRKKYNLGNDKTERS